MATTKSVDTVGKHIVHGAEVVLVTGMLLWGGLQYRKAVRG